MVKIISYVALLIGCIFVLILLDFIEARGILKQKDSDRRLENVDHSKGIQLKEHDEQLLSAKIKVTRCNRPECREIKIKGHRHRHGHGRQENDHKKEKSKKSFRKNAKKRRKGGRRSKEKKQKIHPISPEDIMQTDGVPSDQHQLAAYDQYYAGYGRRFGRLQRPPEADRLERRLHPNIARSAHQLLSSIDRVIMGLKYNIQQMHDTYDFAFNSTRYTMMMGVRDELTSIASANDMVYDVVMDISLLTKDIYMRAHRRGLTRPTTIRLDMPKFASFSDELDSALKEQRQAKAQRDQSQSMVDECTKQTSHLQQMKEAVEENSNHRELNDLVRYINITVRKLQAEFDTAMVTEKLARHSLVSGGSARKDIVDANRLVMDAKRLLRQAADTSRGNQIAYEEWLRRKSGDDYSLAPVSYTDVRSRPISHSNPVSRSKRATTNYISAAEKARLRPIIDRAVSHAGQLRDQAKRMARILEPILKLADQLTDGGNGQVSFRVQASLLADKLMEDIRNIQAILDRIRIAIGDEEELKLRCEELEIGSGDDGEGETTPIDCDEYLEEGSAKGSEEATSKDPDEDSDFVFVGESTPDVKLKKTVKRFGDKLKVHIVHLKQTGDITFVRAQTLENKTHDMSRRWNRAMSDLGITDGFVTGATHFLGDWKREQPNIDRISERIKKVSERVDFISNLTESKTFQAVRKAERKVAEVKGGKGSGTTNGDNGGSANQDFAAAIEAAGKAKRTMRSILTLTRVSPTMVEGVEQKISQIKSNISSLRNKVDKARLLLASLQMSIQKKDDGYLPLKLTASDESPSLHTSVELCIKPDVPDGPVLLMTGNNAESYGLIMESNNLKLIVYDNGGYEIGDIYSNIDMDKEKWYSLRVQRNGTKVSLSVRAEDGENSDVVESALKMSDSQPPPLTAYVGGAPDSLPMSLGSEVWKGCVGGLRVNGRSVGLLQKTSDSNVPVPCGSQCSPSPGTPSLVFEGNGFVHYPVSTVQLRHFIRSVYFEFRTRQKNAFLITVVKRGFQLRAQLNDGTLVVETTTPSEAIVLRSQNNTYNDGVFHTLKIVYRDSTTYPEIDGKDGQFSIEATRPERIRSPAQGIVIGGMIQEYRDRMGSKFSPLIGCVRKLQINGDTLTMAEVESAEGVHVGSCSRHNMWLSCVQFENTSSPIAYGTTEDAKTIVVVATRGSVGPVLQYQKGDKFNAIISLTTKGIEVVEYVKEYDGQLDFSSDDNNSFVVIKVTDDASAVKVEYLEQSVSITYKGAFSGWFGNGEKSPYTVTIGGQEEDSDIPLFTGGIAQMIVGEQYVDMSTYIADNQLSACSRAQVSPVTTTDSVTSRRR